MKNYQFFIIAMILVFGGLFMLGRQTQSTFGGTSTLNSQPCTVTESVAVVGHQVSSTLLSANGRRAWAVISQPLNATNTVALSFNAGAAATLNSPFQLENASTTNGNYDARFGLATDFPYTGAVTGITPSASSTVRVIQCVF